MPKIEVKIWDHFGKLSHRNKFASCNYCQRELSYKTTVTNLKSHLKTKHVEAYNAFLLSEAELEPEDIIHVPESDNDKVTEDSEISANAKTVKRNALIWKHFQKAVWGYKTAICNYCHREISFNTSPSHLRSHLRLKHKTVFKEFLKLCRKRPKNQCDGISLSDDEETQRDNEIWKFFEKFNNGKAVRCNCCFRKVIFNNKKANLKLHLKTQHNEEYNKFLGTRAPRSRNVSNSPSPSSDQELLKELKPEKKRRKRCVPIWKFFKSSDDDNRTALCNYCSRKLSYRTTITNLKSHLQQKHIAEYNEFLTLSGVSVVNKAASLNDNEELNEENLGDGNKNASRRDSGETGSCLSNDANTDKDSNKYQKIMQTDNAKDSKSHDRKYINLSLLKLIIYDLQPLSIVNNIEFRGFIQALNPNYVIPDQKTLTVHLIPELYEKRLQELKKIVSINAKSVCITVDCWTSCALDNYMGVTVHFLTQDPVELKSVFLECSEYDSSHNGSGTHKKIKEIMEKWGLYNKVKFIVTDNAPHMGNAAIYFESEGWSHFMCFAHKLNIVVEAALDEVKETISKMQKIIKYITKNGKTEQDLFKNLVLEQIETELKTLIESTPTRWDTVYLMLERFVEFKESLEAIMFNSEITLPFPTLEEWKLIEQICIILKPFYEVTVEMSSDKYLIASKGYILISNLINICSSYSGSQDLYPIIRAIANKLKYDLKNRLGNILTNEKFGLCTILDPRFKLKGIKNKEQIVRLKDNIKKLMIEIIQEDQNNLGQLASCSIAKSISSDTLSSDVTSYSLWCEFDEEVKKINDVMPDELERYLAEALIKRTEDPLKYWQEHECLYPTLFKVFIRHCNIVVTSVPCEQFYTESGYITKQRRTRLPTTNIAQIMFLNANKM